MQGIFHPMYKNDIKISQGEKKRTGGKSHHLYQV